jgi:hypothetical protein
MAEEFPRQDFGILTGIMTGDLEELVWSGGKFRQSPLNEA